MVTPVEEERLSPRSYLNMQVHWGRRVSEPSCQNETKRSFIQRAAAHFLNTFTLRVSAVALMVSTEFINCPTIKVFFCFFLDNILHQLLLIFKILPWKLESRFFFSDLFIPELYKLLFILAVLQFVISVSAPPLLSNCNLLFSSFPPECVNLW